MPSIKENKYFKKLIKVLFEPKTFFNETQSEVVYKQTFIFLLITLIFSLIISFIVDFIRYRTFVPSIYSAIVLTIVLFVTINLAALIGHLFVYICGGREGLLRTYQSIIYGAAPSLIFAAVPGLAYFAGIYAWFLQVTGLEILQKLSLWRALLAWLILPLLVGVLIGAMGGYYVASMYGYV